MPRAAGRAGPRRVSTAGIRAPGAAAALLLLLAACGTAGAPGSTIQARPAKTPPACDACHVGQIAVREDLIAACWSCHPGVHGGRAAAEEKGLGVECRRCHDPHKGHR